MLVSEFDYDLPPERIAQHPLADRSGSRLLQLDSLHRSWEDRWFREFPDLLRPGDLVVLNNTRVLPARLFGHRTARNTQPLTVHGRASANFGQGRIEVLLTRQVADDPMEWSCLVKPGRKIRLGEKLLFVGETVGELPELEAEVVECGSYGERRIRFAPVSDFFARLERIGHVPLPPYIHREADQPADRDRYQTIYAQPGQAKARSVAAPTAGLHFTSEVLERMRARKIELAQITLHVGLGTFQPVRVERVEDHKLHQESYEISTEAAQVINKAKMEGRRVVAVGTTTVRTLEYAASRGAERDRDQIAPGQGEASLFIYPGYRFRIVDALLTNFHLPQSTLLMMVCALGGKELVLSAYRHAVESAYRFYSYGDCMFVE